VSPTAHLDDGRLSALLDGEASADDVQHADGCPECRTRVASWRAVTTKLVVQPGPVPAQRDAAVEAALAAIEAAVSSSPDRSRPLAGHRRRRAAFSWPRLAGAVAAAVGVAGIAVTISHLGGGGSGPASTAAGVTRPQAASPAARASATPSQNSASVVPTAGVALGSYQDPGGVVAAVRDWLGSRSGAASTPGATPGPPPAAAAVPPPCLTQAASRAKVAPQSVPVLDATLTYRGSPARAYVFAVAGRHTVAVVAEPGCGLLAVGSF
jgi:anti-sigma factor RsiW